jgi:Fe-S-cluster containining protein
MLQNKLITDIPLIERYARQNEKDDLRFRTQLKRLRMPGKQVDAIVRETTDEVWAQIDCTKCANCCRTLDVPVNEHDRARLAARFNMTADGFAERYTKAWPDGDPGERIFASSPCPFLADDNHCTVYEDRPAMCRGYPFLDKDDFRSRTLNIIAQTDTCPIVFNVWRELKNRLQ